MDIETIKNNQYKYNGNTFTVEDLSVISNVSLSVLRSRLVCGMSVHDAVNFPEQFSKLYPYKEACLTIPEIAKIEGIPAHFIDNHIQLNRNKIMPLKDIITNAHYEFKSITDKLIASKKPIKSTISDKPEYRVWAKLRAKCTNKNNQDYAYFGGRGITMCDEWLNDSRSFLRDMGDRPSPKHSIKILDRTKPMSKDNCEWSIIDADFGGKRTKLDITLPDGRQVDIHEACKVLGLKRCTVYERVRLGIPLDTPSKGIYKWEGRNCSAEDLAAINGVPLKQLKQRIARGMPLDKAILPNP